VQQDHERGRGRRVVAVGEVDEGRAVAPEGIEARRLGDRVGRVRPRVGELQHRQRVVRRRVLRRVAVIDGGVGRSGVRRGGVRRGRVRRCGVEHLDVGVMLHCRELVVTATHD